jgi:phage-related minor tail protein
MAMIDLGKLGFDLVLNRKGWKESWAGADEDITRHQSKWSGFASKMGGALKTTIIGGVVAIGAAVAGMAIAGVNAAIQLDDTMAKFRASTGMTAEEADKVKNTVKDLYKVNEASYEDIAAMAESLHNNMQMNADDIKEYAQNYLDYAKVTKQSTEEVVGAIDDIGDAWGLANDEVIPIMDKLKYSQENFGLSVQDSQAALKNMAPAFKGLGMSVDQAIGYLNLFASNGVDSSTSITAFNYALRQVKSPDELQKAIQDIQNTTDATERAQKSVELFGARAGIQMANALKPGTQSVNDITKAMEGANGAVSRASKNYDSSLKTQLALLQKQLQGLFTDLGDKLAPYIKAFVDWLQKNMPKIQEVLTAVFAVVGNVLEKVFDLIGKVAGAFSNLFSGTSDGVNQFQGIFNDFFTWIGELFSSIAEIVGVLLQAIKDLWAQYGEDILAVVKPYWEAIKTAINTVLNNIKGIIKFFTALFKGDWKGAWQAMKDIFMNVWNGIKEILPNLLEGIYNVLKGAAKVLYNIGKSIFNALWEGIKSIWTSIKNWVSDKVNWLVDKLAFWKKGKKEVEEEEDSEESNDYPSYDVGTKYVPYDMVAQIHQGEQIVPADENPYNPQNPPRTGGGGKFIVEVPVIIDGETFARVETPYIDLQQGSNIRTASRGAYAL